VQADLKEIYVSCFRICLIGLVFAALVIGGVACPKSAEQEPPLLLKDDADAKKSDKPSGPAAEEEPLLLLDDEGDTAKSDKPSGPVADNSRCYVCHMNFDGEGLTAMHAKNDVSCEDCHGPSDKHCSDEDNITPPDIMFAADKINALCKGCHPKGKLGEGKKYCVECHGKHRMEHRTRIWDKNTGVLIKDDKVRMLTDEMLKDK